MEGLKKASLSWRSTPLILAMALLSASGWVQAETLAQPIGPGVYEMAFSPAENALFIATAKSGKDKGGVIYRLDPRKLVVQRSINTDLKSFSAAINPRTNVLYVGNTLDSALSSFNASSGKVLNTLVLDSRKRSETVRPLQPREVVVDSNRDRVYVTGLGLESVVWVVDGKTLKLVSTVSNTGNMGTGLALDAAAQKLYVTNFDGELVTISTRTNAIEKRQKIDDGQQHAFLNISLDTRGHRAFLSDAKQPQVLVVDTRTQQIIHKIALPQSLALLFNPARNELYVTHRKAGEVSIVDASSYSVKRTIKASALPNSLALSPDGKTLYVSVKQFGTRQKPPTLPDSVMRIAL